MFYQINVIGKFTPILNRVYFFLLSICASLINWITNLHDLNFYLVPPEFSIHCASDSFDS